MGIRGERLKVRYIYNLWFLGDDSATTPGGGRRVEAGRWKERTSRQTKKHGRELCERLHINSLDVRPIPVVVDVHGRRHGGHSKQSTYRPGT